jgi:hypothetical protein
MTKRKNILQKFGKFFDRLDMEEKVGILTLISAFRGPDNNDDALKWKTTAIIRARLLKYSTIEIDSFISSGDYRFLASPIALMLNQKGKLEEPKLSIKNQHFSVHVGQAYDVLKKLDEL